jgi:hypothetical protein
MLGLKLIKLTEKHSEEIAANLAHRIRTSPHTLAYRDLSEEELRLSLVALYQHLEEWLLHKSEDEVERHFRNTGIRRAGQGVPASQLACAILMSKEQLWGFVYREAAAEKALELYGELEFLEALDRFFDHAVFYALLGYEHGAQAQKAA